MKQITKQFDELRFYLILGLLVIAIAFYTVFFGNL